MISGDVSEVIARYCANSDAIDENISNVVTSSWGDGEVSRITEVSTNCPSRSYRSVSTRSSCNNITKDGESNANSVVSSNSRELITAALANRNAIDENIGDLISIRWSECERRSRTVILTY